MGHPERYNDDTNRGRKFEDTRSNRNRGRRREDCKNITEVSHVLADREYGLLI